jgi:hypothetical protein
VNLDQLRRRFWDKATTLGVFDPLTTDEVARAEAVLGVRLPAAYVALLRVQNGGYVSEDFDAFPTGRPTSWADDHVPLSTLAGIGPDDHHASVTYVARDGGLPGIPAGLVPLSGDGHYYVALDYRHAAADGEPAVTWFDTELDQDFVIAPDFRTFAEGLIPGRTYDEAPDPAAETFHIRHGARDATYCGFTLDGITWVAEEQVEDEDNACPDCLRLRAEWAAVDQPPT